MENFHQDTKYNLLGDDYNQELDLQFEHDHEINNEVSKEVDNRISNDVRHGIGSDLHHGINSEVHNAVNHQVHNEIGDGMHNDVGNGISFNGAYQLDLNNSQNKLSSQFKLLHQQLDQLKTTESAKNSNMGNSTGEELMDNNFHYPEYFNNNQLLFDNNMVTGVDLPVHHNSDNQGGDRNNADSYGQSQKSVKPLIASLLSASTSTSSSLSSTNSNLSLQSLFCPFDNCKYKGSFQSIDYLRRHIKEQHQLNNNKVHKCFGLNEEDGSYWGCNHVFKRPYQLINHWKGRRSLKGCQVPDSLLNKHGIVRDLKELSKKKRRKRRKKLEIELERANNELKNRGNGGDGGDGDNSGGGVGVGVGVGYIL